MFKYTAVTVSFAAVALASTLSRRAGISTSCTSTLTGIGASNASTCLNFRGILPLVTLSSSDSIIPTVDSWLRGMCATEPCSNATITSVADSITKGCGTEIEGLGVNSTTLASLPGYITTYYTVGREVLCTRDVQANNTFCVTTTLNNIQAALGSPLSTSTISNVPTLLKNTTLDKNISCSTCAEGAYGIIKSSLPNTTRSQVENYFNSTCGASSTNATNPDIIVATGTLATATDLAPSGTSTSTSRPSGAAPSFAIVPFAVSSVSILIAAFMWVAL